MAIDPNMGFTIPTDHDTLDTWGFILNQALAVIGGHNHAAGSGGKVSISQLAFDADISFVDSGGGKHAITDLKAIDFFPSAPSAMVGLGGAFFVSDGTSGTVANELYYRTTVGANVQVTSGATLNVGAFAGTIGGDYTSAGALEIFDDLTDAYWFQQQVGAAVRQFAKMRSADLSLFEFKAVGVTPVPGNNITLKVPAGLANTYNLTLPGALPESIAPLVVDSMGNLSTGFGQTKIYHIAMAEPGTFAGSNSALTITGGNSVVLGLGSVSTSDDYLPLDLPVGASITGWNVWLNKVTTAGTVSFKLEDTNLTTGATVQIGATQSSAVSNPGFIQLGETGLSQTVQNGHAYYIRARSAGNTGGTDNVFGYSHIIA
ncbi:MAG: hypothetical protein V4515_15175 [Chloroflexota bacterium]